MNDTFFHKKLSDIITNPCYNLIETINKCGAYQNDTFFHKKDYWSML